MKCDTKIDSIFRKIVSFKRLYRKVSEMIGADMLDSCGRCGKPETPQACRGGSGLAPLKSEHPGVEIDDVLIY
jgi:hypothetical protein